MFSEFQVGTLVDVFGTPGMQARKRRWQGHFRLKFEWMEAWDKL